MPCGWGCGDWLSFGGCEKKRMARIFPVDSAGQWSYIPLISKGNQARLKRKIDRWPIQSLKPPP